MQTLLQNNTRLLRLLFFAVLLMLFAISCKSHKNLTTTATENSEAAALKEKYAVQLAVEKKELQNIALLKFMDEWLGVPYKYGGTDKSGIDCSALTGKLYSSIYGKSCGRSAQDIYDQAKTINTSNLKEGDLVFFKIESKKVSHVGVYITNNKFLHATTKKGVMINDLNENYYKKYFYAAGRIN